MRRSLLVLALAGLCSAASAADGVPTGPLPRTVVPSLVKLDLKLDPKETRFSGTTRMDVDVATPTDVIWMHGKGLKISKAEAIVGKRRIALAASEADVSGVLKLAAAATIPAGKAVLEIAFDAPYGELQGAYKVKPDGNDYVVTQMEPLGARGTFPGFDEPSFKQPWDITLTVPEGDVAVANSLETSTTPAGKGWKQVRFARTEALPSYLVAFAVGPWDVPKGPDIAPNGARKSPIRLRGVAAKGQGGRMQWSLANTPRIVHALEDYFGIAYPFDKLDNLAAPDFWAGAMENAGLIVYRDSLMFPDAKSPVNQQQGFLGTSAHELAHQWFGDLVTMRWWDDLWLNEAFATWMGNKIHGQLDPQAHTDRGILEGAIGAMGVDSLASTRRIHQPIGDFTEIQSAFDGITYQKGGAVLNMFEQYVGPEAFRRGIHDYLVRHARGNATSADLISAVAARSSDPAAVDAAFKSFIDQPGVPVVNVALDCSGKPALRVRQSRYVPIGSQAAAAQTWGIPLAVRYLDAGTVRVQKGIVTGAESRVELRDATSCPTWVMPNADGNGYYRFALDDGLQAGLDGAFAQLNEKEQRVYADSIAAAYGAGRLGVGQMLAALPRFAGAKARQTATVGLGGLGWMQEYLLKDEASRASFRAQAADVYRPRLDALGLLPRDGDTPDDRILRNGLVNQFAFGLKDKAVRDALNAMGRKVLGLDGDGRLHADAVPQEVRGAAMAVAVEEGGKPAFDAAERQLRAASDPTVRSQLLRALSGARDPALAERARALAFEPGLLRRNELFGVVGGLDDPASRVQVRAWIDRHFSELEARLAPAGAAIVSFYAAGMCSDAEADALQAKFGERMATVEGGPLQLKQEVEGIKLCAAQLAARQGEVPAFPKR